MIGWLYLFVNFPLVIFCKIGITGRSIDSRQKSINKAMPGTPVLLCCVPLPFPIVFEMILHTLLRPLRCAWLYRGDGHTEVFFIPAAVVALAFMLCVWVSYVWAGLAVVFGSEAATYGIKEVLLSGLKVK